jgi:hypothetical protein
MNHLEGLRLAPWKILHTDRQGHPLLTTARPIAFGAEQIESIKCDRRQHVTLCPRNYIIERFGKGRIKFQPDLRRRDRPTLAPSLQPRG